MIISEYSINRKGIDIKIRTATKKDGKNMLNYHKVVAVETEFVTRIDDVALREVKAEETIILRAAHDPYKCDLICIVNNNIIAELQGFKCINTLESHVAIFGITVRKDYWGLGIGTELINKFKEISKSWGAEQICIQMVEGNERALNLYKKLGFELISIIPKAYKYSDTLYRGRCILICNL